MQRRTVKRAKSMMMVSREIVNGSWKAYGIQGAILNSMSVGQ
jgi:hypothetical protein